MFLVQGLISMMGMMIGVALISLDHLNKDNTTYLTVGIGMTSSLVGYWLPEPKAPGQKRKKVESETENSGKCDGSNQTECNFSPQAGRQGVSVNGITQTVTKKTKRIQEKLDRSEFSAGIGLSKDIISGIKTEVDREKLAMANAGLTSVDSELVVPPPPTSDKHCCSVSFSCFNPCRKCCPRIRSRASWISKKNGKSLVFLVRSILSILGMLAGMILLVLDQLNEGDGPYLTVGIGLISSIIGYWLPSPNNPNRYKKKNKIKSIPRRRLRKAKIEAQKLTKVVKRKRRRPVNQNQPDNMV